MADVDRIDSVIDRVAVSGEIKATEAEIQQLIALIQSTKSANVNVMSATTFNEYNKAVKVLTAEQYKLIQSQKEVEKATTATTKAAAAAAKQAAADARVTKNITSEYKLLSQAVKDAQERYFNLARTQGRNHPLALQALADANALKTQQVQLNQDVKIFSDNVGNYGTKASSYFSNLAESGKKAFGVIRTAANILPGLGLSGAFLLLFQGLATVANAASEAISKTSESTKALRENKKALESVNEKAILNSVEERVKLSLLVDEYQLVGTSVKRKKQIQDDLQKDYPAYFGNLKTEKEFAMGLTDAYQKLSNALLIKARVQAISNLITENETKALEKEIKQAKELEKGGILDFFKRTNKPVFDEFMKGIENDIKALRATNAMLINEALKSQAELDALGGDPSSGSPKETKEKKSRDLAEANRKADFEREKNRLTVIAEINNKIAADNERHIAERSQAAFRAFIAETDLIQLTADFEKKTKGLTDKEIKVINEKANQDLLKAELKYYESLLKAKKDFDKEYFDEDEKLRTQLEKGIADYFKKFQKDLDEQQAARQRNQDKALKDAEDLAKKKFDLEKQLSTELQNLVFSILDGNITKRKNALQAELDDIERNKAREIELAGNNANLIAGIEARAAVARETIARKQRELDVKKAQFDKLQAIAGIIQNTAVALTNALKNPVLIPLIIAIGAAQLATVLATPIPRYKEGGKHKGGPMIVGDGGRAEGIELPDGTVLKSPATSTLMDAPAGTVIHKDFNKMMFTATMTKPVEYAAKAVTDSSAKVVSGLKAVERAIGKIPQTHIEVSNPLKQRIRYGHSINEHLTRNLGK